MKKWLIILVLLSVSSSVHAFGGGILAGPCDGSGVDFCTGQVVVEVYLEHKFEVGGVKGLQIPVRFAHESDPGMDDLDDLKGDNPPKSGWMNTIKAGIHWEF